MWSVSLIAILSKKMLRWFLKQIFIAQFEARLVSNLSSLLFQLKGWRYWPVNVGRLFKKVELHESIRYASSDPIESWLNGLLCLDVANYIPNISRYVFYCWRLVWCFMLVSYCFTSLSSWFHHRMPHPSECDLYYVNRDTLFSYHKESEIFLQVWTS